LQNADFHNKSAVIRVQEVVLKLANLIEKIKEAKNVLLLESGLDL